MFTLLSKFRRRDHFLCIEVGRYMNIPKVQRLCNKCKVLDDENNFCFYFDINMSLRPNLLAHLKDKMPSFQDLVPYIKLVCILIASPLNLFVTLESLTVCRSEEDRPM